MIDLAERNSSKTGRIVKYGSRTIMGIFVLLVISHYAWKFSGSNEWEPERDVKGIKISTLKAPGETLLKYKMNMRVKAKFADVVFYLTDINTGSDLGATDIKRIERVVAPPIVYNYDTYKIDLGFPLGMREVVILNRYSQDPETKKVEITILAAPNKIHPTEGIKRVLHLSNHWLLTPHENDEVSIEVTSEMDLRVPYFLSNLTVADFVYESSNKMRELLKKDKYKNNQVALINELN